MQCLWWSHLRLSLDRPLQCFMSIFYSSSKQGNYIHNLKKLDCCVSDERVRWHSCHSCGGPRVCALPCQIKKMYCKTGWFEKNLHAYYFVVFWEITVLFLLFSLYAFLLHNAYATQRGMLPIPLSITSGCSGQWSLRLNRDFTGGFRHSGVREASSTYPTLL